MRPKTLKQILEKRYKTIEITGIFKDMLGTVEQNGLWLIWGAEKMGKSTFSIMLANHFAEVGKKVLYVMAEQGFDLDFQNLLKRVNIKDKKKLKFFEYIPMSELRETLSKPRSPEIIFLDNATIYADELSREQIREMQHRYRNKLFVVIAHEQDGKPYTAAAKLISKLSKRIVRIEGNEAMIDGRGPGGVIRIDTEKGMLYHGSAAQEDFIDN